MSPADPAVQEQPRASLARRVVNDFSIQVATVNGSGSQTANLVLLRSILLMGVPVSGKNMFPSNIAGLPTWYTIRASKRGYVGRKKEVEDRKSTRLNSSHSQISYAVFCLKKKNKTTKDRSIVVTTP